jgi:hypothetical protein
MEPESRYSLDGIRRATTDPQRRLIDRVSEVLGSDERIVAAYLVGGFAVGNADAWSDVDLQFVIRDEAEDDVGSSWRDIVEDIAATAHVQPFPFAIGGACITPEWLHFDVVFTPRAQVDPGSIEGMVPLFDKADLLPKGPVPRPDRRGAPFFPSRAVEHFFYMLGNMVSVIGRYEVIPATNGVIMVRDLDLVALLRAEQGWPGTREHSFGNPFPFTKRLREYLSDEQHAVLLGLPPLAPTIDSVIDGYSALARAFVPRARALAVATGDPWPSAYESASVGYFERSLGVSLQLAR